MPETTMPARTDTTHECPGSDCKARVPRSQLACRADWFALPEELRFKVSAAYRRRRWPEHRAAVQEAMRWYRAN